MARSPFLFLTARPDTLHVQQFEAQVSHFVQHSVQRRLIGYAPAQLCGVFHVFDFHALEPFRPTGVECTAHTNDVQRVHGYWFKPVSGAAAWRDKRLPPKRKITITTASHNIATVP